ncbi:MFS transporter [Shewanella sp. NIFS-20-20]|uniref:MFS transporter n=1 Tax=Shewanella sp. NIFS-20-20 TaxID=2853806 RepID=UPI001C47A0E5|nr:MFS transporter [Shewanella sp. NIFS-20-20]MBV7316077.1 MFS transporter [Shewanella sp. NIFS-20-20]
MGLSLFALASGFLMSLIPLSLPAFNLGSHLAPWLASTFYFGLLIGATSIEAIVAKIGHRKAFVAFLQLLLVTVIVMPAFPDANIWLAARFVAGFAVAGVFVVVESWLLMANSAKQRAKRLGLYMTSLYGGTAIGQLAVGPLGTEGWLPFVVIASLLFLASLPPLLIKKGQPTVQGHQAIGWHDLKQISRPALMGCLVSGLVLGPIYGLLPLTLKLQSKTESEIGIIMALVILGGMLIQPVVSYLSSRLSKKMLMAMFSLSGALALGIILITKHHWFHASGYIILGASAFALYPIAISLACDHIERSRIVATTQLMLLSYSVGSVAGPILAGLMPNDRLGLLHYLLLCLATTSIYMMIKSFRSNQNKPVLPQI